MVNVAPILLKRVQETHPELSARLSLYANQLTDIGDNDVLYYSKQDGTYRVSSCAQRVYIVVDEAARVTLHIASMDSSKCTIIAAPYTHVRIITMQACTARYNVQVYGYAQVVWHLLYTQEATAHISVHAQDVYADASVYVLACLSGEQQLHLGTLQEHNAAYSKSAVMVYSLLAQQACIRHEGMLDVSSTAHQVVAVERSQHLVGTTHARAYVVPAMQVRNHDVRCQHAAVVSHLDNDLSSYLQARGLTAQDAQRLLLYAAIAPWYTDLVEDAVHIDVHIKSFIHAMQER